MLKELSSHGKLNTVLSACVDQAVVALVIWFQHVAAADMSIMLSTGSEKDLIS